MISLRLPQRRVRHVQGQGARRHGRLRHVPGKRADEAEKRLGIALFCQAKPSGDIVIECREVDAVKDIQIRTLPCRVQKMERVAGDIMVLHLKLPASERLQFLAGQYIDILMKDGMRRSLSMANPPHDDELSSCIFATTAGRSASTYSPR